MSHTSPRSCELSHCVIARDGTWIFVEAMLAEEETRSEAAASIQKPIGVVFSYRACSDSKATMPFPSSCLDR
nr:hypothetical protein [Evansella caseinilytica]